MKSGVIPRLHDADVYTYIHQSLLRDIVYLHVGDGAAAWGGRGGRNRRVSQQRQIYRAQGVLVCKLMGCDVGLSNQPGTQLRLDDTCLPLRFAILFEKPQSRIDRRPADLTETGKLRQTFFFYAGNRLCTYGGTVCRKAILHSVFVAELPLSAEWYRISRTVVR